jgi:hypothetical protein
MEVRRAYADDVGAALVSDMRASTGFGAAVMSQALTGDARRTVECRVEKGLSDPRERGDRGPVRGIRA